MTQPHSVGDLQVEIPRAGCGRQEADGMRVAWIANVQHRDAAEEPVPDVGLALVHHHLDAVAALVRPRAAEC
jgi:hypothetical protein